MYTNTILTRTHMSQRTIVARVLTYEIKRLRIDSGIMLDEPSGSPFLDVFFPRFRDITSTSRVAPTMASQQLPRRLA